MAVNIRSLAIVHVLIFLFMLSMHGYEFKGGLRGSSEFRCRATVHGTKYKGLYNTKTIKLLASHPVVSPYFRSWAFFVSFTIRTLPVTVTLTIFALRTTFAYRPSQVQYLMIHLSHTYHFLLEELRVSTAFSRWNHHDCRPSSMRQQISHPFNFLSLLVSENDLPQSDAVMSTFLHEQDS